MLLNGISHKLQCFCLTHVCLYGPPSWHWLMCLKWPNFFFPLIIHLMLTWPFIASTHIFDNCDDDHCNYLPMMLIFHLAYRTQKKKHFKLMLIWTNFDLNIWYWKYMKNLPSDWSGHLVVNDEDHSFFMNSY